MCFLDQKKEYGVPGPLLQAIQSAVFMFLVLSWAFSQWVLDFAKAALSLDFNGQGLEVQPRPGMRPNQEPQVYISRFATECEDQHIQNHCSPPENSVLLSLGRARVTATSQEFKYLGVLWWEDGAGDGQVVSVVSAPYLCGEERADL